MKKSILIGNAFPMTLIRGHRVVVSSGCENEIRAEIAAGARVRSFWGHENTRHAAENYLNVSLKSDTPRPAIRLDDNGYPQLDGCSYEQCYVLSPEYRCECRPAIGQEVPAEAIVGWHALKLSWED